MTLGILFAFVCMLLAYLNISSIFIYCSTNAFAFMYTNVM